MPGDLAAQVPPGWPPIGAGGGPRPGAFGRGGLTRGGRLQLSLHHTWRMEETILIREGVAELDLLNGSAAGNRGGRPRHEVEFQAGLYKNGLGARLSANWQSATFVSAGTGGGPLASDLSFSSLFTANLRFFADLGQQRRLVTRFPWLRGARVTLAVDNLFDAQP